MRTVARRAVPFGRALCALLFLGPLLGHALVANAAPAHISAHRAARTHNSHPRVPPTQVQTAVVRYTGLQSLPPKARKEFRSDDSGVIVAADEAEMRCARLIAPGPSPSSNDKVPPCLGLYHGSKATSPIKFHFDLALKSVGAPKDIFIGQCPAGNSNTSCNSFIGEAKAEQERLADTLNRQRRYPVATLGVALSF